MIAYILGTCAKGVYSRYLHRSRTDARGYLEEDAGAPDLLAAQRAQEVREPADP